MNGCETENWHSLTAVRISGIDPLVPNVFADALSLMQMGNHLRNPLKNLDLSVFEEEPES
jgi:hypothetical protein